MTTPAASIPCSPLVRAASLRGAYELLRERLATVAFPVVRFGFPIFRSLRINAQGRAEMFWPENRLVRSQDLPEAFHDAGQFYLVDVAKYLVEGRIVSDDAVPLVLPAWQVQDIDNVEDWERAEMLFRTFLAPPAGTPD